MTRQLSLTTILAVLVSLSTFCQTPQKLSGTVIGTHQSFDYATWQPSTTVNTAVNAFDGDLNTFFATNDRSLTWCGLDLGTRHIITRVGWSPRNDSQGEERVVLGLLEGANNADFSDAVPLHLIDARGTIGSMSYSDVDVSRGFRYVRYVGPNNARCNVAEVEFFGYEGEGDDSHFYRPTNLPLVVVHVADNVEPADKENNLDCLVSLIGADGATIATKTATIRLRGNASMGFPKKPYRLKFDKKTTVFGSPASAKKWTLINNYGDKTLMRNMLAFELSRQMGMPFTPYCQAVDVMVNGEYKGCYQLCDQIEVGSGRVEVDKMSSDANADEALTGGYFVEVDAYANEEDSYFYSKRGNPVTIKYPDSDDITAEQTDYIRGHFNEMETLLYGQDYTSTTGYRTHLDLNTFLRHFLVGELSGNTDTYWSTYMYKQRGDDHFYVGPVWDFDLAFDNDNRTHPIHTKSDWLFYQGGSYAGKMRDFVSRIVRKDAQAIEQLEQIWHDCRANGLSAAMMNEYVDLLADSLDASQRLNFVRWPILNQRVHQNWQAAGSYQGEVDIVKDYIEKRFEWIDNKLHYTADGISEVTLQPADAPAGIYSLDGKRIASSTRQLPKGIYIIGGKKVVVR